MFDQTNTHTAMKIKFSLVCACGCRACECGHQRVINSPLRSSLTHRNPLPALTCPPPSKSVVAFAFGPKTGAKWPRNDEKENWAAKIYY